MTEKKFTADELEAAARGCWQAGQSKLAAMLRQAANDQKDAERYRWLNDIGCTFYTDVDTPNEKRHHVCEWAMNAAIDTAMHPQTAARTKP